MPDSSVPPMDTHRHLVIDPESRVRPASKRFKHLLVATDFSRGSQTAVERAVRLAAHLDARVTVVHVLPAGATLEAVGIAKGFLHRYAYDPRAQVLTSVATGSIGVEIAQQAERLQADIIVVGAHGAHWLRDVFIGSTVEAILQMSTLPVLIVKDAALRPYASVLLAVDDSRPSFWAAQYGLDLTPHAHHVAAHTVVVPGDNLLRLRGATDSDLEGFHSTQLAEVRPRIDDLAGELVPRPDDIVVESGRPETRIPEMAGQHGANLVVAGTERSAGVRHTLLGSVSRHVIQRVDCDVLIVPHP